MQAQLLRRIHITGIVQGVGFRPFVYQLATHYGLPGWVCNTSSGVEIEVEGDRASLDAFQHALVAKAPPLAHIDRLTAVDSHPTGYTTFEIRHSVAQAGQFQPLSPDISTCPDCLRELFDPANRRYGYPFTNCTHCGPRFTIIQDIPYDRPNTTMRPFAMCPACQSEYDNPSDRRFHAQPNACPVCGPRVQLVAGTLENSEELGGTQSLSEESGFDVRSNFQGCSRDLMGEEALRRTQELLSAGKIVAVKGLGGFHLACDALNDAAVQTLRERKGRVDKPFALMMPDIKTVEQYCYVDDAERALLTSRERPIVLLRARPHIPISKHVAPNNPFLGVMLPYTPLHYLLMAESRGQMAETPLAADRTPSALSYRLSAIVMTSGNYSEEPIATDNDEALSRLSALADAFLLHNRDIFARCDDSVMRVFRGQEMPLRRSRGYAPFPVRLPFKVRQVLAVGGELKNTFCLTREDYAFLSQHIGDMENLETLRSFEAMVEHFKRTFRIEPEIIAHDMHPGYLSTRYAQSVAGYKLKVEGPESSTLHLQPVQHHHAHIAACMAEHGLTEPVIGVAFDGTGYGADGHIWGGEFLVCDYAGFRRAAHLAYVPLPGGDAATRRPYRIAWSQLHHAYGTVEVDVPALRGLSQMERRIVQQQIEKGLNAPLTSSMGRLFDAVSALVGVRHEVNYEAQAAIELEMLAAEGVEEAYPWDYQPSPPAPFSLTGRGGDNDGLPSSYGVQSAARAVRSAPCGGERPGERVEYRIDPAPLIRAIVADLQAGVSAPIISARFHNAIAEMIRAVCLLIREQTGLNQVCLSGGVFQNITLLGGTWDRLQAVGFEVFIHRRVPANDGGIALGQAMIAHASRLHNFAFWR